MTLAPLNIDTLETVGTLYVRWTVAGNPWHGLWKNGAILLPNSDTKAHTHSGGGSTWPLSFSGPGASRSEAEQAIDDALGHTWLDYGLMSGRSHCFYGKDLGAKSWVFQGGTANWRVTASIDTASTTGISLDLAIARFSPFGAPAADLTDTVSISYAQTSTLSPTLSSGWDIVLHDITLDGRKTLWMVTMTSGSFTRAPVTMFEVECDEVDGEITITATEYEAHSRHYFPLTTTSDINNTGWPRYDLVASSEFITDCNIEIVSDTGVRISGTGNYVTTAVNDTSYWRRTLKQEAHYTLFGYYDEAGNVSLVESAYEYEYERFYYKETDWAPKSGVCGSRTGDCPGGQVYCEIVLWDSYKTKTGREIDYFKYGLKRAGAWIAGQWQQKSYELLNVTRYKASYWISGSSCATASIGAGAPGGYSTLSDPLWSETINTGMLGTDVQNHPQGWELIRSFCYIGAWHVYNRIGQPNQYIRLEVADLHTFGWAWQNGANTNIPDLIYPIGTYDADWTGASVSTAMLRYGQAPFLTWNKQDSSVAYDGTTPVCFY